MINSLAINYLPDADERDIERLAESSASLAVMGEAGLAAALEGLKGFDSRTSASTEALLRAIRWSDQPLTQSQQEALLKALDVLAHSEDVDLRQAVYETAARLSTLVAKAFLARVAETEVDEGARETIEEVQEDLADKGLV